MTSQLTGMLLDFTLTVLLILHDSVLVMSRMHRTREFKLTLMVNVIYLLFKFPVMRYFSHFR